MQPSKILMMMLAQTGNYAKTLKKITSKVIFIQPNICFFD